MAETAEIIGGRGGEGAAKPTIIGGHGIDLNERVSIANKCKELRFGTSSPFFFFFSFLFFFPHRIPLITDISPQ